MATRIIGIGDLAVSASKGDVLKTFALGSCIGVVVIDPDTKVTGMLHLVLPDSATSPERAEKTPGYFADSGLAALVSAMEAKGCKKSRRWKVKLAGGASVISGIKNDTMEIGKRNLLATKKHLWKLGLAAIAEDVGKNHSRTISITVGETGLLVSNQQIGNVTI